MRSLLSARTRVRVKTIRNAPIKLLRHKWLRFASRNTDIAEVRTVCLAVGPYRNLTTLTASLCGLHPNCQALNHGGNQILRDRRLNFLRDYSDERFDAFTRFAVYVSANSRKGVQWGGSIVGSHAFKRDAMREAYAERFGDELVKEHVHSVFWKESLRTSNLLRNEKVDLGAIFARNDKLRFLYPVRNPLACALSNIKVGHVRLFDGLGRDATLHQVIEAVLREFAWMLDQHDRWPDRFFYFFESDDIGRVAADLASFLRLDADPQWMEGVKKAYQLDGSYEYDAATLDFYASRVRRQFAGRTAIAERLLAFATPAAVPG